MRKYWQLFQISVGNTFAYRGPIVIWLLGNVITTLTFVTVWFSASTNGPIAGFSRNELVAYYIFGLLVNWLTNWFPFYWIKDEIADGSVVGSTLTKPLSNYWRVFAVETGWHFVTLFVGLAATALILIFFRQNVTFFTSYTNLVLAGLSIIFSIFLTFSLSMCMGCLAFWFTKVSAIDDFFWACRMLIGGQSIPIALLPSTVRTIANILPFRYMFSFPLEIYLGKLDSTQLVIAFAMQILWIIAFIFIYQLLWIHGNRAYTAFGH